jgi:alkanesulfonate monooxygenase SsuD/methylene tetrahydromethanopterin reductase-like flavin-dependent oxidoreductase (luciferase family)
MAPKVGYLLPTRESVMQGRPAAAPLLKLAERAEELGYDSIWIGDSLLDRPRHEPLVMLAGVAGRTKRVLLGTGVLLPALRNPVQLAHQVATLDQISEGRLILGIGISPDQPGIHAEFDAVGVPFENVSDGCAKAALPRALDWRAGDVGRPVAAGERGDRSGPAP